MRKYLKYSVCNILAIVGIFSFLAGGYYLWMAYLLGAFISLAGDTWLPKDVSQHTYIKTGVLNTFLYINLPLLLVANLALLWQFSNEDILGLGQWVFDTFGWAINSSKSDTTFGQRLGGFINMALMVGMAGTNVAHELVHRTWKPWSAEIGRALLAFTWDSEFAIEHVYGHHGTIGTWEDPASARRGESFLHFFWRSTIGGNRSAWRIEKKFLKKKGRSVWTWRNRLIRGWFMSLMLAVISFVLAGWAGLLLHLAIAFHGKMYLEQINYIQHYGLVRVPNTPVHHRHSWNSNAVISSIFLFNLSRHSHHHESGHLPFWKLHPKLEAPMLPYGYLTMLMMALVPPVFRRVMEPALKEWDENWATPEERKLAVKHLG